MKSKLTLTAACKSGSVPWVEIPPTCVSFGLLRCQMISVFPIGGFVTAPTQNRLATRSLEANDGLVDGNSTHRIPQSYKMPCPQCSFSLHLPLHNFSEAQLVSQPSISTPSPCATIASRSHQNRPLGARHLFINNFPSPYHLIRVETALGTVRLSECPPTARPVQRRLPR